MAYRRRFRRYRKRRTTRKNLKTTSILNRKSATAQANQILALRKYVNRVRKMIPPINKMVSGGSAIEYLYSSSDLTNVGNVYNFPLPSLYSGDYAIEGENTDYRTGNWIKIHAMYISTQIAYDFVSGAQSQYDGDYSGAQVRFVMIASRKAGVSAPGLTNIFQVVGTSGNSYDLNMTVPLKEGVGNDFIILGQQKYTLSTVNRLKSFRIKIPLKRIKYYISWRVSQTDTSTVPKHNIFIAIITSGLKYQGITTAAENRIRIVLRPWLVFSNP